uniref:Translocon-associated protein subunit delta n=1 Tax=Taeniopygia guttata TaxID=59729 RepID=A0A674GVW6_TAEGU
MATWRLRMRRGAAVAPPSSPQAGRPPFYPRVRRIAHAQHIVPPPPCLSHAPAPLGPASASSASHVARGPGGALASHWSEGARVPARRVLIGERAGAAGGDWLLLAGAGPAVGARGRSWRAPGRSRCCCCCWRRPGPRASRAPSPPSPPPTTPPRTPSSPPRACSWWRSPWSARTAPRWDPRGLGGGEGPPKYPPLSAPPPQNVALYADVNGKQFPVTRGQDVGRYQVSWSLEHRQAHSGTYEVKFFDEESYSALRKVGTPPQIWGAPGTPKIPPDFPSPLKPSRRHPAPQIQPQNRGGKPKLSPKVEEKTQIRPKN